MSIDLLRAPPPGLSGAVLSPTPTYGRRDTLWNSRPIALGAVAVLVLASLWLRSRALHFHYWIDEGLSVGISQHPLSQIPSLLRQDGSPPLYYLLLHVWMALRGTSEVATHELSLSLALVTVVAAYWAGSSLLDRRTGVICALLAAGVPYLTDYGQETRMYALLALLSLLVATSFLHVFVGRRRGYIPVFVGSLTAAMYTHNWALFLAVMAGLAFALRVRSSRQSERPALWLDAAICLGAVAALYAPWVPTVIYQARHTGAPWASPPVLWSLSQGSYFLVGGRGAAIALLLGGGVVLVAAAGSRAADRRLALVIRCLLVLGIGTMLLAWLYSHVTPAWAPRYLAVVVGPMILLFGIGLARSGRLGLIALALACSFWVLDPVPASLDSKSNVASAVASIRPKLRPGTLVLSTQPEQVPTLAYYLRGGFRYATPLGPVPDPRVVDWRNALPRFRRSSVRSVLRPILGSLAPGQRLLLVVPTRVTPTPEWMRLIDDTSRQWSRALERDPSLRRIGSTGVSPYAPGIAVKTMLYVDVGRVVSHGIAH